MRASLNHNFNISVQNHSTVPHTKIIALGLPLSENICAFKLPWQAEF